MKGSDSERDFYRQIIGRSKRLRERAADSLRRTRESRRRQTGDRDVANAGRRPRFRRQD
jgi:hypothetical protein